MPTLLAYHADDRIRSVEFAVGLPLAVIVIVVCAALWARIPAEQGHDPAKPVLIIALVQVPLAIVAQLLFALLLFPVWLALVAYAARAAWRAPSRMGVAALAVSGLTASYLAASAIACVVTDACFH